MLVDLPEGWDLHRDQISAILAPDSPNRRLARGMYLGHYNSNHDIRPLIKNEYPFSKAQREFFLIPLEDIDAMTEAEREAHRDHLNAVFSGPQDYGVCDYPEQVVLKWPELERDPRRLVIFFAEVVKDPSNKFRGGGWRWHKWGTYIGTREPQYEYLDDEDDDIQRVFCFHIFEVH